jgi:hypothetical protein
MAHVTRSPRKATPDTANRSLDGRQNAKARAAAGLTRRNDAALAARLEQTKERIAAKERRDAELLAAANLPSTRRRRRRHR